MTEPHAFVVIVDRPHYLAPSVLHRVRWNPHVLGASAYPMAARPADPGWGVPPLDHGHHVRWHIDPRRGSPTAGFYVYQRSHELYADAPTHDVDFTAEPDRVGVGSWAHDVGERRPVKIRHGAGFSIRTRVGLDLPPDPAALETTLPTSGRAVRLRLVNVPAGATIRATHAKRLVHYQRTTRPQDDWVVVCHDVVDEIQLTAPGARILRLAWIRVPGDLAGWLPLARFPALGTAPLDRAGIAARLGDVQLTDEERDEHLSRVLDSIRAGPTAEPLTWQADGGGPGLETDPGMLLSTLTLWPQLAWAFGRYLVDPQPAWVPTDYLVVGAWFDPRFAPRSATGPAAGDAPGTPQPITAAAPAAGATPPLPFLPGGPALDELINVLADHPGLLYFAPCYFVAAARAWEPPFARLASFEAVEAEARRQLDDQGRALLEVPLRATWSLHRGDGLPVLAAQQPPLAEVTISGPGADATPRTVVSAAAAEGTRASVDVVAPRLTELPGTVQVSITPLDLFGHLTGPPTTDTLVLPASLYPAAPPPIGVIPEVVPPTGAGSPDLRVSWLWGGRLRLFHPRVHGFMVEWLHDTDLPANLPVREALRNGALSWNALPQVAALAPRAARIDALELALAGQSTAAVLLREGAAFMAGLKTDLSIAPGATGRFDGWTVLLGAQSFVVARHALGNDAWLYINLPSEPAGTPFAALAGGEEQPYSVPWTLAPRGTAAAAVARISGDAAELQALVPGSLVTQGPLVFGVLACVSGPPVLALLDVRPGPQEPGGPPPPRPAPSLGDVEFDAPMTALLAGVAVTPPTPSHALRKIWVRVRTVDFLDRSGPAGTAMDAAWPKSTPPEPAVGPAVVGRSPPDAFGRCKLLVRFDRTIAEHGCVLYRASDTQLGVVFELAKKKVTTPQPEGTQPPTFVLPEGFVWPTGGPQRPEDVTDPMEDFRTLPDMTRVFYNELRIDEGGGPPPVFLDAFERRGRMARPDQPDQLFAAANDAPLEFEDVVDRAGNRYLYLVRLIDRADQEGGVSGVSWPPGQGWDIAAPPAPQLLPVLVTRDELIVRWLPPLDERITSYGVTLTPQWQGASTTVVEGAPDRFRSLIRVEGDRIALPDFVLTPAVTDVTSVKTADGVEHVREGFVMPAEQQFVWWCAGGNRGVAVATPTAGDDLRDRVPARYGLGVANGSSVNPVPLVLYRGVLGEKPGGSQRETEEENRPLQLAPGTFASLLAQEPGGTFTDRTSTGAWHDDAFLTPPAVLGEGEGVVLEAAAVDGTRRTFGRCPAAPGQPAIAVTGGVIPLDAVRSRLAAGDRPSGVFRASAVTRATGTGEPDPRGAGATDFIDATTWWKSGFVRRLRNGVPVVVRWRRASDGAERCLGAAAGGRPLRFLDGSLVVPPWDPTREVLDGVYERATVNVSGTTVAVPASARNLAPDLIADARTGRLVTFLPDGVRVKVRLQDGTEIAARFDPLEWHARRLGVDGLFADGVLAPEALFTLEPNGAGQLVPRTDRDRLTSVDVAPDGTVLVAKGVPAEGAEVALEYNADGVARTVDPRRLEWSIPLSAAEVGRSWQVSVEALCDFPDPVGVVSSLPATTRVEVAPPATLDIKITSARWTAGNALEIRYEGPADLTYQVAAVSKTTGDRYILADPAAGGVVSTAIATDGTAVPLTEPLSIELRGAFPNAPRAYLSEPAHVDALVPADVE